MKSVSCQTNVIALFLFFYLNFLNFFRSLIENIFCFVWWLQLRFSKWSYRSAAKLFDCGHHFQNFRYYNEIRRIL